MTLKVNINLLQDNNGVAGESIAEDRILVSDSFFVELEVEDVRENAAGIIGLALDVEWDASVLEALDTEITNKLPFNPQGIIDNESGAINALGAGAIPNFDRGSAIGINEPERFALLHFQGEIATDNPIPLTVSVSNPGSVAFADGMPFSGETDIGVQTVEIVPVPSIENIDRAPVVNQKIANVIVREDAANSVIDLKDVFIDADNDSAAINKTILANSNEALVASSLDGNNLTLDYQDNQFGTAVITVEGESNGKRVTDNFVILVNPIDDAPVIDNEIADVVVNENAGDRTIDLNNVFDDIDGDEITLAVKNNSNETLVATALDGNSLTLDFLDEQFGSAAITLEATANGKTVEDTFTVNVKAIEEPAVPSLELTEVHRFYQYKTGFHFYTTDTTEIDYIKEKSESGELAYSYEAEKYQVLSNNVDVLTGEEIEGVEPIYRFFNTGTGAHLYTMNEDEKDYVVSNLSNYNFEGIKYYAFEIEPENVETVPVYRMLNTQSGAHLFSSDLNEIGYIEENLPHFAMENEGNAAFHVLEL